MTRAPALLALLLLTPTAQPLPAAEITLYRCVDAKGKLTLRDSPCAKGEKQETRTFQRPVDPPPRPAAQQAAPPPPPSPPPEVRYVTVHPPRPLYECVTPDGERYTSDTDAGNPRWVPLWTLGYPWPQRVFRSEGMTISTPSRPPHIRPPTRPHPIHPAIYASGTYIADECYALPQQEVCARLSDRRYEIKRRYLNAMPSERALLDDEERAVVARINNDCGTG